MRWSFGASSTSRPALAALLSATVPLFGLPLAHRYLRAEPLTRRKIVGVLLGLLGVAVVFSGELGTGGPQAFAASAGIIVAALATAHASVLVKARGTHIEPAVLAGTQMLGGCLPLLIGGMLLEGSPLAFRWTPMALGALAYLTILGSVIAFLMYYWLIRHTSGYRRAHDSPGHSADCSAGGSRLRGRVDWVAHRAGWKRDHFGRGAGSPRGHKHKK